MISTLWNLIRLAGRRFARLGVPIVSVVAPTGWVVLGGGIATLVVGLVLGWSELICVGVALLAAFSCSFGFVFGRVAFAVKIELSPRRVVAGSRARGLMVLTNVRDKPSGETRFELPVGRGLAQFLIPGLAAGAEHEELFTVPTNTRAVIVAGPAESIRGDELGMLRRVVRWAEPVELFVHPLTATLKPSAAGLLRDLEGEVTKTITNSDISFHALRAYEPGDDRRYVHWRTSARTGQLMVRQFEETRRSELIVLFADDESYYETVDEFELAVSILASLAVQIIRDGTRISVLTSSEDLRTTTAQSLLDDSCRITSSAGAFASARDFARIRTARLAPTSVVMIVSGSRFSTAEFRSIQHYFGFDTQTIGFRAASGAAPRVDSKDGLRLATVGQLGDLPRVVRRTS